MALPEAQGAAPGALAPSGTPTPAPAPLAPPGRGWRWQSLGRWEVALVGFVIATILYGTIESHYFLSGANFFDFGLNIGPIALMALPLTFIVMTGEIDLSVASTLGLACSLLGYLFAHGWPLPLAIITVLSMGVATGTLNGVLVTRFGPAFVGGHHRHPHLVPGHRRDHPRQQLGDRFPQLPTTPWGLHRSLIPSSPGRSASSSSWPSSSVSSCTPPPWAGPSFAIGLNKETAFFSGIRVKRVKLLLYTLSGLICAAAGVLWTFQYATSRYDAGTGLELDVVTVVLFGGVSIFGGKGTIIGVLMAVCVLGGLQSAMTLINVSAQAQEVVTGCLLIVSVVLPNSGATLGYLRTKWGVGPLLGRERADNPTARYGLGAGRTSGYHWWPAPQGGKSVVRQRARSNQ